MEPDYDEEDEEQVELDIQQILRRKDNALTIATIFFYTVVMLIVLGSVVFW